MLCEGPASPGAFYLIDQPRVLKPRGEKRAITSPAVAPGRTAHKDRRLPPCTHLPDPLAVPGPGGTSNFPRQEIDLRHILIRGVADSPQPLAPGRQPSGFLMVLLFKAGTECLIRDNPLNKSVLACANRQSLPPDDTALAGL